MSLQPKTLGLILLSVVVFILACNIGATPAANQPDFDPTKMALEFQATAMSLQLTQAALNSQPPAQATPPPFEPATAPPG